MKNRFALVSPFLVAALGLAGGQVAAGCNGSLDTASGDAGADADAVAPATGDANSSLPPIPGSDAAVVNCMVTKGEDYISFCVQKQILLAEHAVFDPKVGLASSWNAKTGTPDADGGAVLHDVRDDVAYGASLSLYEVSAEVYADTEIASSVVTPDLLALAPLVEAELATLPATYDGELYMRLRRFAAGLELIDDTKDGAAIDAIAQAYGEAIYTGRTSTRSSPRLLSSTQATLAPMPATAATRGTRATRVTMPPPRPTPPPRRFWRTMASSAYPSQAPRRAFCTTSIRPPRVRLRWSTLQAALR